MKHLIPKFKEIVNDTQYISDIERIVKICEKGRYFISYNDAKIVWEEYSDMFAATWLNLPVSDEELFTTILNNTTVIEV